MYESMLIDIGNIMFFIANFPQLRAAYKNRKDNLKGLSTWFLLLLIFGSILFTIGNSHFGAYVGASLNLVSIVFYVIQLYWKRCCR